MRGSPETRVVAVVASDLHLTLTPPAARGETQEQWLESQRFYLEQVRDLKMRHAAVVVYPGDIFDDGWRPHKCPPELVNFAIKHLPKGYAVPGQHDLPHHNYEDKHRSAYWTLCEAGVLTDLQPNSHLCVGKDERLVLHGFPWGFRPTPWAAKTRPEYVRLAVCHSYIWANTDTSYPGAPGEQKVLGYAKELDGYTVAVFGDNHKGFLTSILRDGHHGPKQPVLNCGTFLRRHSDEKAYNPHVGLVYADGHVERKPLYGTGKDLWKEDYADPRPEEVEFVSEAMVKALRRGGRGIDFAACLRQELTGVRKAVTDHVIAALERGLE